MTINKRAVLALLCFDLAILVLPLSTGEAKAQTTALDEVKQRGVLRAGVRQDVPASAVLTRRVRLSVSTLMSPRSLLSGLVSKLSLCRSLRQRASRCCSRGASIS